MKNKIVSIKLKEYLQKNNISQAQLAERAGMRKILFLKLQIIKKEELSLIALSE